MKRITKKTENDTDVAEVKAADAKLKKTVVKKSAKKAVAKKTTEAQPAAQVISSLTAETLLAPLVTEKNAHLADAGVYVFAVPLLANRVAVRQAFRELYKVTPVKVNIVRVHGKEHRFGQVASRRSDWKKALITVPKGKHIDIFEKI